MGLLRRCTDDLSRFLNQKFFVGAGAFTDVMNSRHGFLERNAILARAVSEPLESEDRERLERNGIKAWALTTASGEHIPDWLTKWASLICDYVEKEELLIPESLLANEQMSYTPLSARIEARGVKRSRLFNVVTTLDKVKYFLTNQSAGLSTPPPLERLSEQETCDYLWNSSDSIAARSILAAKKFLPASAKMSDSQQKNAENLRPQITFEHLQALRQSSCRSLDTALSSLQDLATSLRSLGPSHHAVADMLTLYASTKRWFRATNLESFSSEPISFEGDDRVPEEFSAHNIKPDQERFLSRKYLGQYCWGQLVSWFKQTIYRPEASLSADRRGTMSLPDPESSYGNHQHYCSQVRKRSSLERVTIIYGSFCKQC